MKNKFLSVNAFFSKERVVKKMRGRADAALTRRLLADELSR